MNDTKLQEAFAGVCNDCNVSAKLQAYDTNGDKLPTLQLVKCPLCGGQLSPITEEEYEAEFGQEASDGE